MNSLSATRITQPIIRRMVAWPEWFVVFSGGILALDGSAKLLAILDKSQQLYFSEPIAGIEFRHLFIVLGIAEVLVACLCLFTKKRNLTLVLMAWLAANFLVYRIGLWTMGWPHPYVFLASVMKILDTSPIIADRIISLFAVILFGGSTTLLWFGNGNLRDFIKMSCLSCGGHIKFDSQNIGQKIPCPHCETTVTLRAGENLKMSCFFCKEHIEFPPHAIGEKMPCPHCKMDITLMEPPLRNRDPNLSILNSEP